MASQAPARGGARRIASTSACGRIWLVGLSGAPNTTSRGRCASNAALEILDDPLRIAVRQVRPGLRIHHAQPDDPRAWHRKGQLPFVVRVRRIHQHHGVAGIEQRAEQVVGQLRAAGADGHVFRSEPWTSNRCDSNRASCSRQSMSPSVAV